jgi:hypothetical protein
VCLTPVGIAAVPIPYMIVSQLAWSEMTVNHTTITEMNAFTMNSRTNRVTGDEPGVNGGVSSGVNGGWCRPRSNKTSVLVGGHALIENDNLYDMNCAGPEGAGNTVGRLIYFE